MNLPGLVLPVILVVASAASARNINEIMQDASDTMLRMLPALYAEEPDRALVMEGLVKLDDLIGQAEPHFAKGQEGARVTYGLLGERLEDAIALGERRNINLMRGAVNDAFELCASCHTQDRKMKRAFGISKIRNLDEYLAGEFSYLTRDYESALTSFANYLKSDERTLERDASAFDRVLVITAEVLADPLMASEVLAAMQKQLDPEGSISRYVTDWVRALGRLSADRGTLASPLDKKSVSELDTYLDREWPAIQASLAWPEQDAYWVVIRSELNRFLSQGAKASEVPKLLYWLAVSDRALQYRFYSSLSKGYLEQCILAHPRDPYARRCLEEYEMLILVSFSGSMGTFVPPEVQAQLNQLRRLVYQREQ